MTYLGRCKLTEHDTDPDERNHSVIPGEWIPATCAESDQARSAQPVSVWSTLTDLDGEYGAPCMFAEWGSPDGTAPVVADLRWMAEDDTRPCEHRVYVLRANR
jgi:hypothetical protein